MRHEGFPCDEIHPNQRHMHVISTAVFCFTRYGYGKHKGWIFLANQPVFRLDLTSSEYCLDDGYR